MAVWGGRIWTAPAERSGDGAFGRTGNIIHAKDCRACESGVALRLPPQSKTRWRAGRCPPNRAQRLGVRQPAGALGGRDGENGHWAGAGEGRAGNPLPAAACQPMRSGTPRRRARSDAPDHGGRLVAGDQDLAKGSLGWTSGAKGV